MIWETAQHLTDLPPISPETRRFIAAFINFDQDINQLAEHLNDDFFDVVHKLCDPVVKVWITAINALKDNERRQRSLRALDDALTSERDPNAIRRAATRILRHLELHRPKTPRPAHADTSDARPSPQPALPKSLSPHSHTLPTTLHTCRIECRPEGSQQHSHEAAHHTMESNHSQRAPNLRHSVLEPDTTSEN